MALFKKTMEKREMQKISSTLKLINGYCPVFTSFQGGLYEMELTRSAIDRIATQCSKLNPVVSQGRKYKSLVEILKTQPNPIMTPQQFMYRLVTILLVENNTYIVPIYKNKLADEIIGFYPARAEGSRITTINNIEYLIYKIDDKEYAIEYDRVGHIRRHYYKKEYFGSSNSAMKPTLELMDAQNQGIKEGIKSSAMIRFVAKLSNILKSEDIIAEQKRLKDEQLSVENNGGVLIFDNKYADIKQVNSTPFIVDKEQMALIKANVFDYFQMSEEILQNKASEDSCNQFYENVIEPIAIQISQALSKIIIALEDRKKGIEVILESNRLQFISNNTKLQVSQQLFDRGILTTNQVNDIWNLPHVEGGDKRYIRKEYTEVNNLDKEEQKNDQSGKQETDKSNGNSNTTESEKNEDNN